MDFWKQFKPSSCSVGLKASTKEEALREVVKNLVKAKVLAPELEEDAVRALEEREKLASTGIGMGVAVPHVKLPGLERVACNLSVHHDGLEWQAIDNAPVHVIFTVLRPERAGEHHDPERHLAMMTWIAKLGRDHDFRSFCLQARTKTMLVDLLKEMSAV